MLIGYARVSTQDQNADLQVNTLKNGIGIDKRNIWDKNMGRRHGRISYKRGRKIIAFLDLLIITIISTSLESSRVRASPAKTFPCFLRPLFLKKCESRFNYG